MYTQARRGSFVTLSDKGSFLMEEFRSYPGSKINRLNLPEGSIVIDLTASSITSATDEKNNQIISLENSLKRAQTGADQTAYHRDQKRLKSSWRMDAFKDIHCQSYTHHNK